MKTVVITFMIVSVIFALASLAYAAIDMIIEERDKKKEKNEETKD